MKIYNTLTRRKEDLVPLQDNTVRIYTCGPTVYDYAHIGNLRTYVFEDALVRVLEWLGFTTLRVMNITDVGHLTSDADTGEDKIEVGARREGRSAWEIAAFYTEAFLSDMKKLRIKEADVLCKATDHVSEMIQIIQELERRGFTYKISDGIYFDTSRLKDYGNMALVDLEQLKAGARVEMVPGKKNATDFALWKLTPKQTDAEGVMRPVKRQMEWDSPWGRGFPGWHIECSAMSMKYITDAFLSGVFKPEKFQTIDVHGGGVDHINVHHTNEIAQSEGATGKKFVNYWVHGEFLLVEGQKMAKSLGNLYTVADLEKKGYSPLAFRLLCLMSHYRNQMNFTFNALDDAEKNLETVNDFFCRVEDYLKWSAVPELKEAPLLVEEFREKIRLKLADDLNTPEALAVFFDFMSEINKLLDRNVLGRESLGLVRDFVLELDDVFCFLQPKGELTDVEQDLLEKREAARAAKDYEKSDHYRARLRSMGVVLEDTPYGTRWRRTKFKEE
ncbi:MAG: cysteine--tRNA ligase [Candidatus Aenigmarchaeota archaeon]|nr:cysteine--tRNA ligase [Candidatus Aenigmarchaeota archaeon]